MKTSINQGYMAIFGYCDSLVLLSHSSDGRGVAAGVTHHTSSFKFESVYIRLAGHDYHLCQDLLMFLNIFAVIINCFEALDTSFGSLLQQHVLLMWRLKSEGSKMSPWGFAESS